MAQQVQMAKKPTTAYFLWLNSKREEIQKEVGAKDVKSVSARASELWKAISEAEKKPFEKEAKRQRDAFQTFKGTAEGRKFLQEKKAESKTKKNAKDLKAAKFGVKAAVKAAVKAVEKDPALKKPQTAYFLWLNSNRERILAALEVKTVPEVGKKASEMWKAVSDEDRKPWEDKAKQQKEAYNAFLETPEGSAALQACKDAKKAAADETKRKAIEEGADASRKKKPRGAGQGEGDARQQQEPAHVPKDVLVACWAAQKKAGLANAFGSYESLVRKLLEDERLAKEGLKPSQALWALESSNGLLNKARDMLYSKLGA